MVLSFFQKYLGVKVDQTGTTIVETLVNWDPKGASEAQLRQMESHLDELAQELAKARQTYEKEEKEFEAINALLHQRMEAAERLQASYDGESDPARKASLEKSLTTLLEMLEKMTPDVEREKQDAVEAKQWLDELQVAFQQAGEKLKSARAELERAQRDMARAEQQKHIAEEREEAARRVAGLSPQGTSIEIALNAMRSNADKARADADAKNAKATLLRPSKPEEEDANIKAAMDAAAGKTPVTSLSERLAALKAKSGS